MNDVMVIIPARDEVSTIGAIIARVKALGYQVVVIDDASSDGTSEAASIAGAEVLVLKRQRGNLGAIQAGLIWALELKDIRWFVTLDADGQHAPEDIPSLLQAIDGKEKRLVIGSCPERSSWMRQMVWAFFRKISGIKVQDMTSGFKVYSRRAANCLASKKTERLGFQDVPTLLMFNCLNFDIYEIKVNMVPRCVGISRVFSSWGKVTKYMFKVTFRCCLHRPHMLFLLLCRRMDIRKRLRSRKRHIAASTASSRLL